MFDKIIAKLALSAVLATFIGVPLASWYYDSVYLPESELVADFARLDANGDSKLTPDEFDSPKLDQDGDGALSLDEFRDGTKVFTFYWSAKKGLSLKPINGMNYWYKGSDQLNEIKVREGDRVVFRHISADVHHGFAFPAFGIPDPDQVDETGLLYIRPGDITKVEFVADRPGSFEFNCTIMCGVKEIHENMRAKLIVMPAGADGNLTQVSLPEVDASATAGLIRSTGEAFDFESLRGHVWVASFFFSTCPSSCLTMNQQIAKLQKTFQEEDVKFVSITCDPQTDTPEILKLYAESLQADESNWIFLTGDLKKIVEIGNETFMVPVGKKTHSTHLILVDRQGMVRNTYKALDADQITGLRKEIVEVLLEEK